MPLAWLKIQNRRWLLFSGFHVNALGVSYWGICGQLHHRGSVKERLKKSFNVLKTLNTEIEQKWAPDHTWWRKEQTLKLSEKLKRNKIGEKEFSGIHTHCTEETWRIFNGFQGFNHSFICVEQSIWSLATVQTTISMAILCGCITE